MLGQLGVFAAVLVFFHLSEFALAVIYMRDQLSTKCKCRQVQGPFTPSGQAQSLEQPTCPCVLAGQVHP
jgi:hypothetical protein